MKKLTAAGVVALVLAAFAGTRAGGALRVSDPLQLAAAIVVINGRVSAP